MEENIYAAPESSIDALNPGDMFHEFYVVSKRKFYWLFFLTLGAYAIYWHFKNWQQYKKKNHAKLLPIIRGIFSIFFTHALFREVDEKLKKQEKPFDWNARNLASLVVLAAISSNIFDRLSSKDIGSPYTDLLSILFVPILGVLIFKAQKAINFCCNDPLGETNDNFTVWNIMWMVLGSAIIVLAVIGAVLPEEFLAS